MIEPVYLGIDPGKSGAIACINGDGTELDSIAWSAGLQDVDEWMKDKTRNKSPRCILEQVGPLLDHRKKPIAGKRAMTWGMCFGHCEMILVSNRVSFKRYTPPKWMKLMSCMTGGDKKISKARAQELFPDHKITLINPDAILLAELCRRENEAF